MQHLSPSPRPTTPARLLALGAFAVSLAVPPAVLAQPAAGGRFPPGRPEARLIEQNAEKLGLDAETVAAVRKLADASREQDEKRLEATRKASARLRELLDQELPDEAALLEQAEVISKAGSEAQRQRLRNTVQVRALLTPEQRAKFMEIRREARPPRPGGPRPGGGR